jgi:glutamate dehydrogenase
MIVTRADQEFEVLWRTHGKTGKPISELADSVSECINGITREVAESSLFDNQSLRLAALLQHVPSVLLKAIGMETLMKRLPEAYQRAVVARSVASTFVYRKGLEAGFEDYRLFIEELGGKAASPGGHAGL